MPIFLRTGLVLLLSSVCTHAGILSLVRPRDSTISLKKRLHVNTLITEPGTVEIDWASVYSFTSTNFNMPTLIKYTPQGRSIIWGRTEYSVGFNSIENADLGGGRLTQFSQSMTVTATSVLRDGQKFDFAIAPQATFFLRDEKGVRLGAVAIARWDVGQNSIGTTLSWSGATNPSPANPAGTLDAGFGFGRRLAPGGFVGKFTPHVNVVWERSTGIQAVTSVFEGVEYQITERLAFDVSAQHFAIGNAAHDNQLVLGVTANLGHGH